MKKDMPTPWLEQHWLWTFHWSRWVVHSSLTMRRGARHREVRFLYIGNRLSFHSISESCFSCQIVSVNIYSLLGRAVGKEQKINVSGMNLFLHFSSSTPNISESEPGGRCYCNDWPQWGSLNSASPSSSNLSNNSNSTALILPQV